MVSILGQNMFLEMFFKFLKFLGNIVGVVEMLLYGCGFVELVPSIPLVLGDHR